MDLSKLIKKFTKSLTKKRSKDVKCNASSTIDFLNENHLDLSASPNSYAIPIVSPKVSKQNDDSPLWKDQFLEDHCQDSYPNFISTQYQYPGHFYYQNPKESDNRRDSQIIDERPQTLVESPKFLVQKQPYFELFEDERNYNVPNPGKKISNYAENSTSSFKTESTFLDTPTRPYLNKTGAKSTNLTKTREELIPNGIEHHRSYSSDITTPRKNIDPPRFLNKQNIPLSAETLVGDKLPKSNPIFGSINSKYYNKRLANSLPPNPAQIAMGDLALAIAPKQATFPKTKPVLDLSKPISVQLHRPISHPFLSAEVLVWESYIPPQTNITT